MSCIGRAAEGYPGPHVYGRLGYCAWCRQPNEQRRELDKAVRDLKNELMRPIEWPANWLVRLLPSPKPTEPQCTAADPEEGTQP